MQVSEILKRFHCGENGEDLDNGRESHLSVPSSSETRSSFVINSPRPSAGLSRCGTGRGQRPRFPIEVDVRNQEQWEELMTKEGLIVVDAYSGWCGPCKAIESTFRRIRNETGDDLLHFAMAETDNIDSLEAYRDKSQPTFLFFGDGQLVNVIRGCDAPLLNRSIAHFLNEEHKILSGEAERKLLIDTEALLDGQQKEKEDEEKEEGDEDLEIVEVPKEISVVIIKPDALESGHADDIIKNIEDCGIEILEKEEKVLSKEEAAEFYKQHEGSEYFEQLIEFMSSGPVLSLVLSKRGDDPGHGLIPEIRDLIGPKDVNLAKEEAPNSIRAQYGTDSIMNAVHSCDSSDSAARELAFFFPDFNVPKVQEKRRKPRIQRTLALIRPGAYAQRKDSILRKVEEAGFNVAMSKEMYLSREQAEEFYEQHKGESYFESLINNMTSGPSLALCLAREDAVDSWRSLIGPKEVSVAKETAPESLRAVFADEDAEINPLHGADSVEAAEKELRTFFPPQATVAVIKPEAYSVPEQREQIVDKIKKAGFKISAQKEISLTKELASQFYEEHQGKEFFDGLTEYMSSGPTLFMILSREDAVAGFRALVGPTEPEVAKETAPESLRALYATDSMKNAIHSSSNPSKAAETIHEFFPEVVLNQDGTIKEPETLEENQSSNQAEEQLLEEQPINGMMEIEQEHQEGESQKASSVDDVNKESEEVIGDATPGVENTKDQSNENTDSNEGDAINPKVEEESDGKVNTKEADVEEKSNELEAKQDNEDAAEHQDRTETSDERESSKTAEVKGSADVEESDSTQENSKTANETIDNENKIEDKDSPGIIKDNENANTEASSDSKDTPEVQNDKNTNGSEANVTDQ